MFLIPSSSTNFAVLCVICVISVNNYFGYHAPSAIANEYEEYYGLDNQQFGTLFTVYSLPNVALVFFSGMFIDDYGITRASILFNSIILVGLFICAIAPFPSDTFSPRLSYYCLLLGRLFLGLGGESICTCVSTMIARWFTHSGHLNAATAVNQAFVQFAGSSAAFFLLPKLHSLALSQWVTVGVGIICILACFLYAIFDRKYELYLKSVHLKVDSEIKSKTELIMHEQHSMQYPPIQNFVPSITEAANQHSRYEAIIRANPMDEDGCEGACTGDGMNSYIDEIASVLNSFSRIFWILVVHIGCMSPILYTFTAFGPLYLQENFETTSTPVTAGNAISLLYLSIMTAPLSGAVIDYIGFRYEIQFVCSLMIPILCSLLSYHVLEPYLCLCFMGIVFSITESNSLALVALVVPSDKLGAAYGLIACSISFALLIEPALVGYLRESSGSFTSSIWVFIIVSGVGAVLALVLVVYSRIYKL